MSIRRIVEAFEDWRRDSEPMVLATVFETAGSTYSKSGQRILIRANGDYQGLVSGGCLEGDLAERARAVLEGGTAAAVTYDMRDDADDLFGLGVGCNGMIRVFLQRLTRESEYQPFATIARLLFSRRTSCVATVVYSDDEALPPGMTLVAESGSSVLFADHDGERLLQGCVAAIEAGSARFDESEGIGVLYAPIQPLPNLLVLGAGLDAVPVVSIALELGWRVSVGDHRPSYIERNDMAAAERVALIDPKELASEFELDGFDAVIVMSHHLRTDQEYLGRLAEANLGYLGVLGPVARKERLLDELGERGDALRGRLHGPVGIDIGADSPESIALSLLAEIHSALKLGSPD
ncbi:MAG: XdhC family protein [Gammaproteobacteria bacterium]